MKNIVSLKKLKLNNEQPAILPCIKMITGCPKHHSISLKVMLLILAWLINPYSGHAQEENKKCIIKSLNGKFDTKAHIKEFLYDSLLLKVKTTQGKIYELKVPINQVSTITLYSKLKSGRGALKGLLIGAPLATLVGIAIGASEPGPQGSKIGSLTDLSIGQGIVFANFFITPVSTLIGLVAGSRKKIKFIIHGDLESYHGQLEEIKRLLNTE